MTDQERNYQEHLEEFGVLPFERAKPTKGTLGGRPETFAMLNEDQTYFVLTLSRNTHKVVSLKKRLVSEYGRLRKKGAQQARLGRPPFWAGIYQYISFGIYKTDPQPIIIIGAWRVVYGGCRYQVDQG